MISQHPNKCSHHERHAGIIFFPPFGTTYWLVWNWQLWDGVCLSLSLHVMKKPLAVSLCAQQKDLFLGAQWQANVSIDEPTVGPLQSEPRSKGLCGLIVIALDNVGNIRSESGSWTGQRGLSPTTCLSFKTFCLLIPRFKWIWTSSTSHSGFVLCPAAPKCKTFSYSCRNVIRSGQQGEGGEWTSNRIERHINKWKEAWLV